jgi:polyisoprenoid-binding protein YceI/rhodanese-related sulfurtransferase
MNMQVLTNSDYEKIKEQQHTLIHVLPKEHYEHFHLENAINICVYETSFIQSVQDLHLRDEDVIIVYGECDNELEAKAAADKLTGMGFKNVLVLEAQKGDQDTDQLLSIKDARYSLMDNSKLQWEGGNTNGSHKGDISLKRGYINSSSEVLSGEFMIDMNSINTLDISQDEGALYLNEHLRSEDFFLSTLFPEAIFRFENIVPVDTPYQTDINYILEGALIMRGITKTLKVNALISTVEDKLILTSKVSLDRTQWGILYGSAKFFKFLGMHKIFDTIYIEMRLELNA